MTTGSVQGGAPLGFDAFYTQLKDKKNPTILSCLRAIHEISPLEGNSIEALATLVRTGKNSQKKEYKDLARTIADLMVKSRFFSEAERGVRDIFLKASSYTWHNIKMRIGEWARMRCNQKLYGGIKSKENQKKLANAATEAMFGAVLKAQKPDEIIELFKQHFDEKAPKVKGTDLFKKAFLRELEANQNEYQAWWKELRFWERLELDERDDHEEKLVPKLSVRRTMLHPKDEPQSLRIAKERVHEELRKLESLLTEKGKPQTPEEDRQLAEAWKNLRKAQRQVQTVETSSRREEMRWRLFVVKFGVTQACTGAPTIDDIPTHFKDFLTGIYKNKPWVKDVVEQFNQAFANDRQSYVRQWTFYHPGIPAGSNP
jgi:hypothetical protein